MTIQQNNQPDKPEEAEGGAAWEVRTAADMLADATGNPQAGVAFHRAIEGTVNATIAAMAPSFTTTFSGVLENTLRAELGTVKDKLTENGNTTAAVAKALLMIDERLTNADRASLDWRVQWRKENDAQRDFIHKELDSVSAQLGGVKGIATKTDLLEKEVGDLRSADTEKFKRLEQLEKGNIALGKRIDALTKVQAAAQDRQRDIEERAAVYLMSGEERARLMLWFQANAPKLQALIDANEAQQADER